MRISSKRIYICLNCGYNTTKFHHCPCSRCGTYEFKKRVKDTHIEWDIWKTCLPKIRIVIKAPVACTYHSYTYAAKCYREAIRESKRYAEHPNLNDFMSQSYRKIAKALLKVMREIKSE